MIPALRRALCVNATNTFSKQTRENALNSIATSINASSKGATGAKPFWFHKFSTAPQLKRVDEEEEDTRVLVMPPNLKIDPRCVSSPFYGLDKIGSKGAEEHSASEELETAAAGEEKVDDTEDDSGDDDGYDIEYDDDDDESEGTLYDLSNAREPTYAIPLPKRLHVPIMHFSKTDRGAESAGPEASGTLHLSSSVFGCDPIRVDILHRCVVYQRSKKRGKRNNGARTKTISEVSGSGRKVRPQKGGGTARAGHSRPPHWRGGAKAHGPKGALQDYTTKLNKKVRVMAVKMALSQKLKEGNLILVDGFHNLDSFKTKALADILESLGDISGRYGCTAYLVDHALDDQPQQQEDPDNAIVTSVGGIHVNLKVASKNLFKLKVTNQRFLNVYDILKYEKLVMSLSALQAIEQRMCDDA